MVAAFSPVRIAVMAVAHAADSGASSSTSNMASQRPAYPGKPLQWPLLLTFRPIFISGKGALRQVLRRAIQVLSVW